MICQKRFNASNGECMARKFGEEAVHLAKQTQDVQRRYGHSGAQSLPARLSRVAADLSDLSLKRSFLKSKILFSSVCLQTIFHFQSYFSFMQKSSAYSMALAFRSAHVPSSAEWRPSDNSLHRNKSFRKILFQPAPTCKLIKHLEMLLSASFACVNLIDRLSSGRICECKLFEFQNRSVWDATRKRKKIILEFWPSY